MNSNVMTLAQVQEKYKGCNLLMPVATEAQINPYYKMTVMEVKADLSDNSGDIFKVGSQKMGEGFVNTYSPSKPLLMKLAAAAGIQFDPDHTFGTYISKNCYKAKAFGAMRMPDGTGKTHADEKCISLDDEEDNYRLEAMDKSIKGISDWRAAKAAAEMFKGTWVETGETNDNGYPIKVYKIADEDRQSYIDRYVLVNMTQLRKTMAQKAMTGAILRVIRALIGLKGTYTKEELRKPFAIPRVTFSPDYNNPEVRQAMLNQGISSMTNMFGPVPTALMTPVSHESGIMDVDFRAGDADNPTFASDITREPNTPISVSDSESENDGAVPVTSDVPPMECADCGKEITQKVFQYSVSKYERPLCYVCQNKESGR